MPDNEVTEMRGDLSDTSAQEERQAGEQPEPLRAGMYSKAYIAVAKELAQLGADDDTFQRAFTVSGKMLREWQDANPDFAAACRAGKEALGQAMYRRAMGYDVIERRIVMSKQGPVVVEEKRHIPADPRAAALCLQHYAPKQAERESPFAQLYRELVGTALRPKDPRRPERPV